MARRRPLRSQLAAAFAVLLVLVAPALVAAPAAATTVSSTTTITMSDGVQLTATLSGDGSISPRPTVVEFTPYGPGTASLPASNAYNYLLVQIRGTGASGGSFDALGPRTQQDVAETLQWACTQPWSQQQLALAGFSASAITVYNSLHLALPCVKAMVLKSGTFELYRDLLVPGGILNVGPGAGVLGLIGVPTLEQSAPRLTDPLGALGTATGFVTSGFEGFSHPTLDNWWVQRGFQGDVNKVPALLIDGWFDVESRGAFQGFQQLQSEGVASQVLVVGGHDGSPVGTDGGVAQANAWLDHFVRGVANGVDSQPPVQELVADGSRESYLAGDYISATAGGWPRPGTKWADLNLSPARSGSATSLNDGSLSLATPSSSAVSVAPNLASWPTQTDVPTTALLGSAGFNQLSAAVPQLTQMNPPETTGLTFTSPPLGHDVTATGPLDLDLPLATSTPGSGIWAVLTDVGPDGVSHPLTVGRLNTSFPNIVVSKSLFSGGVLVQPYGDFSSMSPATPGVSRMYHVEFWPVGNRFQAGHRIRLDIVGVSAFSTLSLPGISAVSVGAGTGAVLRFPVAPGEDLSSALS